MSTPATLLATKAIRLLLAASGLSVVVLASSSCTEPAAGPARAKARFSQCTPCHGENGEGKPEQIAPAIAGLPSWYVEQQLHHFRSGIRGTHFDDLGGMRMKPMSIALPCPRVRPADLGNPMKDGDCEGRDDVKDMAEYVASLPAPPRMAATISASPTAGRQLFAACAACHGADGGGNPAMKAPPIAGHADWYVYTQLKNFKHGVRGSNPKDTQGMIMAGIAKGLPDDAALRNLAQFVSELPVRRPN
jgi:cytochrome c oxidase subunit 2